MAARLIGIVAKTSACSASLCQATCPAKQPRKPGDFGAGKNPALPYPFVAPVRRRATDKAGCWRGAWHHAGAHPSTVAERRKLVESGR